MRKIIATAVAVLFLAACGGQVERENVEGVDCVIARNNTGTEVIAVSCDWGTAEPSVP